MYCGSCQINLHEDDLIDGRGKYHGQLVHLHDFGPGHADVAAHPVERTTSRRARTGYRSPGGRELTAPPVVSPPPAGLSRAMQAASNVQFWSDVSQWQNRAYDDSYARPFAEYRVSLSTTIVDTYASPNAQWCHAHVGQSIVGHMGYHVWYPGSEQAQVDYFLRHSIVDPTFVAMIDVETWSGSIAGDHSANITVVAEALAAALSPDRVKVYGNTGDLDALYPKRPPWLGIVRAGYGQLQPPRPWQAWQYSNGGTQWAPPPGWPISSPPFGGCDHNAFLGTVAELQAAFGINNGGLLNLDTDAQKYIADQVNAGAKEAAGLVHADEAGTMTRTVTILADAVQTLTNLAALKASVDANTAAINGLPAAIAAALPTDPGKLNGTALAALIQPHLALALDVK